MSAIVLLASGARADRGFGVGVSVAAHAIVRLTCTLLATLSKCPQLTIAIDTGPTAQGPWREVHTASFTTPHWPAAGEPRIQLGAADLDEFIRARWDGHAGTANLGHVTPSADFDLTISGIGTPDAA